jgi:hypothetical protein
MAKSMRPWTKLHDAISATADTSEIIDCRGCNALAVYTTFSAAQNWTFAVLGAMSKTDPFIQCYDNATAMTKQTNAALMFVFHNVPDYVMVKATEDVNGATVSVWVAPCTV